MQEAQPKPTEIIMGGRRVDVGIRVISYEETGWQFVGRPRAYTRGCIAHQTGAENPPAAMYANMMNHAVYGKRQPLSVHFCVDQAGTIYQMADTEMRCAHAVGKGGERSANGWSIGIEFIGRGADWKKVPARGFHRTRVTEPIHGMPTVYEELFDAQVTAGVRLIERLCDVYNLPMRVPTDTKGNPHGNLLEDQAYDTWRGVLSHPHVEMNRADISFRLMRAVEARGRALTKPVA